MTVLEPREGWMAALSPSAREAADAVARKRTGRLDLAGLVEAWVASVRVILRDHGEKYYDDYLCYVGWREFLDEVLAVVPEADAAVIAHAIEPADIAFRNGTIDDGGQALSRVRNVRTDRWYWRRIPTEGPIARSLGL